MGATVHFSLQIFTEAHEIWKYRSDIRMQSRLDQSCASENVWWIISRVIQNGDGLVERDAVRALLTPLKSQPLINLLLVSVNMKTLSCMFVAI